MCQWILELVNVQGWKPEVGRKQQTDFNSSDFKPKELLINNFRLVVNSQAIVKHYNNLN
jgi:hypothetical protein